MNNQKVAECFLNQKNAGGIIKMKYQFKKPNITVTTKGYWHDNCVNTIIVNADSLKNAVEKWAGIIEETHYIKISNNARKNPEKMYIDDKNGNSKQIGLIFNGLTEIQNNKGKWKKVYIKLWTDINILKDIF